MITHHMNGAGNRFVVIDGRTVEETHLHLNQISELVPSLCQREVLNLPDAEGVLVLTQSGPSGFDCLFFNPDGSSGMMCGNGSRCIVKFAVDRTEILRGQEPIPFTINGSVYEGKELENGAITVLFPKPISERTVEVTPPLASPGMVYYVDVNSDHLVLFDMPNIVLSEIIFLRNYKQFSNGCNVNIIHSITNDVIRLSTFERGVEAITEACGTGAISTAVACWRFNKTQASVTIIPPSSQPLHVEIIHKQNEIQSILLTGPAEYDAEPMEFDTTKNQYLRV